MRVDLRHRSRLLFAAVCCRYFFWGLYLRCVPRRRCSPSRLAYARSASAQYAANLQGLFVLKVSTMPPRFVAPWFVLAAYAITAAAPHFAVADEPPAASLPDASSPGESTGEPNGKSNALAEPAESGSPAGIGSRRENQRAAAPLNSDEDYELFELFVETIDQVERNYVKKVGRKELIEAAVQGVISKLDPYSSYISPDEIGQFKLGVESQFGGIGIQIGIENDQLKVLSPLVGTPAYRAGIEAGDLIVEINGQSAEGIGLDEAVRRLKGEAGTSVSLVVIHYGETERKPLTIEREVVHVDTVVGAHRQSDDSWQYLLDPEKRIGYVRVNAFSRDTTQELKSALANATQRGIRGLVLDLRFNPGGLLTTAVEVSDLFVSSGRIVSTEGRSSPTRVWDAQKEGTFEGFSMVVLVNRYSASASEIVAACLQDHQRAVIVGERTWGKGSVQNVVELGGGKSALKLTTAAYHRPSGKNIHRFPESKETDEWGVSPNPGYEVKLSDDELIALMHDRRQRELVHRHGESPDLEPTAWLQTLLSGDRQLRKAYDYLAQEIALAP